MLDRLFVKRYPKDMIKNIRHKGLRNYWTKGRTGGLNINWLPKLRIILAALETAEDPKDMNVPGLYFHALKGDLAGFYSVRLTGNYRVIFRSEEDGFASVDIMDYH